MSISENQHYLAYVHAFSFGRYDEARRELATAIHQVDGFSKSILVRAMGKLECICGNGRGAVHCFRLAQRIDNHSIMSRYEFAKFLQEQGRSSAAKRKARRVLSDLEGGAPLEEGDFSREEYLEALQRILLS